MSVNSNGDYEALAKLLYPSIEASGNVYYGQTRKLTMDEVFDKYKGGFESHIESRRVEDISSEYGFKYEKYFCWAVGPLSGEFCIDGDGAHHVPMESYPLYYAKYLLNKTIVAEENVLNSGAYNSYHYDVEPKLKKIFYHGGKNPCDDNTWDGKSFYIVKDGDDYYLYVAIINRIQNDVGLLPEEYDPDNPLCFEAYSSIDVGYYGVSLKLESHGNITHKDIYEYSYDKVTWDDFVIDSTVVPIGPAVGQDYLRVYVRFKNGTSKDSYVAFQDYVNFTIDSVQGDGYINIYGDIRSMQQNKTSLQAYEFCSLFYNFEYAKKLPDLPCKALAEGCYQCMFEGCSNVVNPPKLYATTLVDKCYSQMFDLCTSMVKAPTLLLASEVPPYAYSFMFRQSAIRQGPYIFASNADNSALREMFSTCSSLNSVYCAIGDQTADTNSFNLWLASTSPVLHTSADAEWSVADTNIIPDGCTIVRDFALEYTYDD